MINARASLYKVPVNLVRFQRDLYFLDIFLKKLEISDCIKLIPVGTVSSHADGQT
jgi:hypothetical protein